jgi:hypothetical protein
MLSIAVRSAAANPSSAPLTDLRAPLERVRKLWLLVCGAGEAFGHCHDHGDVDHCFVVGGQGLVVAYAAAVLADPAEGGERGKPWEAGRSWGSGPELSNVPPAPK